jgi:hypothetical protein
LLILSKNRPEIRDLVYYQYAKIIARRAFGAADGKEAKKQSYGFIKKTFEELKSGAKSWSEITREDPGLRHAGAGRRMRMGSGEAVRILRK